VSFGKRVRQARERKGLSLKELGERLGGMSYSTLSKIENGGSTSERTKIALARELNDDFGEDWLRDYLIKPNSHGDDEDRFQILSLKYRELPDGRRGPIDTLLEVVEREMERIKKAK
jgi:transcriptional regulator with XRE-family HTH domain